MKIKYLLVVPIMPEDSVSKEDILEEGDSEICLSSLSTYNLNGEMAKQIGSNKLLYNWIHLDAVRIQGRAGSVWVAYKNRTKLEHLFVIDEWDLEMQE